MSSNKQADRAAFVLRTGLGAMYLAHSVVLKLMKFGLDGTAMFFNSIGLPRWLAYVTFVAKAIGDALLILGDQSRWVALALMLTLLGAIIWVHAGNGWVFTAANGGWEYPAFLLVASLVQVFLERGDFALSRSAPLLRPSSPSARTNPQNGVFHMQHELCNIDNAHDRRRLMLTQG